MYHRSSRFNYVQYNYIGWWLAWNLHAICSLQPDCFILSIGNSPIWQKAWQKSQYQVWVLLETAKVKTGVKLLDLLSPYPLEGEWTWFTNIMIVKESLIIKMYNKYRQSQSSSMKNMKMYMHIKKNPNTSEIVQSPFMYKGLCIFVYILSNYVFITEISFYLPFYTCQL